MLWLEKGEVLRCEWVDSVSNLANLAISLFFASLADVTSHADLLMRGPRNFSRLEGIAIVCFEGVNGDSNIPFAIRKAGWRGEGLGVRAREGRSGPITHTVVLRQAVVGFALVGCRSSSENSPEVTWHDGG